MKPTFLLIALAAILCNYHVEAALLGPRQQQQSGCPTVWSTIVTDFKKDFAGCNDLARSAIRFAFHDAATFSTSLPSYSPASGGADGSLLLSDSEVSRRDNRPMKENYRDKYLLPEYNQYKNQNISAADFVQFAGSVGIVSCPGGPIVRTVVGRRDSSTPAPDGLLPQAFGPGSDYQSLIDLWESKTFSPRELAALMGAHSVSRSFAQRQIPPGSPQDSTPTEWDVKYYSQTQSQPSFLPQGVHSFDSDVNLSNATTEAGRAFRDFAGDAERWKAEFAAAMAKLSVLGISADEVEGFVDCTDCCGELIGLALVSALGMCNTL